VGGVWVRVGEKEGGQGGAVVLVITRGSRVTQGLENPQKTPQAFCSSNKAGSL